MRQTQLMSVLDTRTDVLDAVTACATAAKRAAPALAAATDEAALVEAMGGSVRVVKAPPENIKITRPVDIEVAEAVLRSRSEA